MITLESLLLLLIGLFAGRMFSAGFVGQYFNLGMDSLLKWQITSTGFLVDIITIGGFLGSLWRAQRPWTDRQKLHYFSVVSCVMLFVVIFFTFSVRLLNNKPLAAHDGVVQTEVAATMILHGQNPYAANFTGTPFAAFHTIRPDGTQSVVLQHYPYPPLIPLLTVPAILVERLIHFTPDGRVVTALIFFLTAWALIRLMPTDRQKTWVVLGVLINPLFMSYALLGMNDIIMVSGLIFTAILARQKKWRLAGITIALAIAAKQTALLALPLWAWWLWLEMRHGQVTKRKLWQSFGLTAAVVTALYLPFILWNPAAFYDDTVRFVSGVVPHTYPIGGDSLWQFLVMGHFVPDAWVTTSTLLPLLLAAVLVIPLACWWIRRRAVASQWLTSVVLVIFVVSLVNRYFYENYLSAVVLLAVAAYCISLVDRPEKTIARPPDKA